MGLLESLQSYNGIKKQDATLKMVALLFTEYHFLFVKDWEKRGWVSFDEFNVKIFCSYEGLYPGSPTIRQIVSGEVLFTMDYFGAWMDGIHNKTVSVTIEEQEILSCEKRWWGRYHLEWTMRSKALEDLIFPAAENIIATYDAMSAKRKQEQRNRHLAVLQKAENEKLQLAQFETRFGVKR